MDSEAINSDAMFIWEPAACILCYFFYDEDWNHRVILKDFNNERNFDEMTTVWSKNTDTILRLQVLPQLVTSLKNSTYQTFFQIFQSSLANLRFFFNF